MVLRPEVVERLILCKSLLARIRFSPIAKPDRATLAAQIISAHDAAELGIAAVCHQLGVSPPKDQNYLMSYFQPLADAQHKGRDVYAKDYFSQLNRVRVDIKHLGIFPDPQQWARVGETVHGHVSKWCQDYLGIPLSEIDHSSLLIHEDVKVAYYAGRERAENGDFKECLEFLAKALYLLFQQNAALRGLSVGKASSEDAIRLTGFGVPANDYLALQEFLPAVKEALDKSLEVQWRQQPYGHPGNWRPNAAEFCLQTFLDVALKIQYAEWIPGAVHRDSLYDFKVVPMHQEAEVWIWEDDPHQAPIDNSNVWTATLLGRKRVRKQVALITNNNPFVGRVLPQTSNGGFYGGSGKIESLELRERDTFKAIGNVDFEDVQVSLVPRKGVEKMFPWELPEIPWEPD